MDLPDLLAAAGKPAIQATRAATRAWRPLLRSRVRDRLGLIPTGMIDLSVHSGGRWIAVRRAGLHHPDGVPSSLTTQAALARLLGMPRETPPREALPRETPPRETPRGMLRPAPPTP